MYDKKAYVNEDLGITLEVQVHRTHEEVQAAFHMLIPEAIGKVDPQATAFCISHGLDYTLLFSREHLHVETLLHELAHFALRYQMHLAEREDDLAYEDKDVLSNLEEVETPGEEEQIAIDIGVIGADIIAWWTRDYELNALEAEEIGGVERDQTLPDRVSETLEALWLRSNN
jgi:hypothetical protein